MNQCDGCVQNLPTIGGIHHGKKGYLIMCTKDRYQLSPAVVSVVDDLISITAQPATFQDYERAKFALSCACGFHAPPDKYDQEQYDAALRLYCQKVGL